MNDLTEPTAVLKCGLAGLWLVTSPAAFAQALQPRWTQLADANSIDAQPGDLAAARQANAANSKAQAATSPSRAAPPGATPGPPLGFMTPGGPSGPPLRPQLLRWTENWAPLADRSVKRSILEELRYIPLEGSPTNYLSVGGEVRYAFQHFSSVALRSGPNTELSNFQQRLRLIGDLHVGPNFRAFVELGDDRELASTFATPINRDHVDVRQAFADITVPLSQDMRATVRGGRFELLVGSTKLIGLREARGNRFFFDGGRATVIAKNKLVVDAFVVNPVDIHPGAFDDRTIDQNQLRGVYVSSARGTLIPSGTVAVYLLDHDRPFARLSNMAGRDQRSSWGALVNGRVGAIDYSVEGTYQSGHFANKVIDAHAVFLEAGYTFAKAAMSPRLGVRFNALSGDKNKADGEVGTFAAPFGQAPLFTEAAWFAFSNIVDLYPSVTIRPTSRISISAGPDITWRASSTDSMYFVASGFPSVLPVGAQRYVGTVYNLQSDVPLTKNLTLRAQLSRFDRSASFKQGGGANGTFFEFWTALRF